MTSVDVILAEVGKIEDHVFRMRNEMEVRDQSRKQSMRNRKSREKAAIEQGRQQATAMGQGNGPAYQKQDSEYKVLGKAAAALQGKSKTGVKREVRNCEERIDELGMI